MSPKRQTVRFGRKKKVLPVPGFEPQTVHPNMSSEYINRTSLSRCINAGNKTLATERKSKFFFHIDHMILPSPLLQVVSIEMTTHNPQTAHTTNTSLLCHYNEPRFHPRLHPLTDQSETVAVMQDREYKRKNKYKDKKESDKKTAFR